MECCMQKHFEVIKEYDPTPKNQDGSIRWFLYRWDDGKNGVRRLVRCQKCGTLYLVQAYHLHKFSERKDTLFEDFYTVKDEREADDLNQTYTGIQLEHKLTPSFRF
ncbi:MAG: hypothetical protein IJ043_09165 [Clostridia bacterium]|nr:hypothetical protein [Clostridia bacterium]